MASQPTKKKDWLPTASLLLGILGALAWLSPLLYELIQQPVVKGKIVGLSYAMGGKNSAYDPISESTIELTGTRYYPKLILTSLKGDFNIRSVEVFVKYPDDPKIYSGTTFYRPVSKMRVGADVEASEWRELRIPPEEHVATLFVIERGKVAPVWIPFVVDKTPFVFFKQIEFRFTDYRGRKQSVLVKAEEIDFQNIIYESKYWSDALPGQ
jgi:hypothetical protein